MQALPKLGGIVLFFTSLVSTRDPNNSFDLAAVFETKFCPTDGIWPKTPFKEHSVVDCMLFENREIYEKLKYCKVKRYCSNEGWGNEEFTAMLSREVNLTVITTGRVCHITLNRYLTEDNVITAWEKWVSGPEGECLAEEMFSEYLDLVQRTAARLGATPESCLELEVNNAECRDHGLLKFGLYADSVCQNQVVIYLPWVHLSTLLIILMTVCIVISMVIGFPFKTNEWFKEKNPMPVVTSVSKEKDGEPVCHVCSDRSPDHMFIKCGHLGFCKECCNKQEGKCPFCNTPGPCSKVFHVASKPE